MIDEDDEQSEAAKEIEFGEAMRLHGLIGASGRPWFRVGVIVM